MNITLPSLTELLGYLKALFSGLAEPKSILIQLLVLGAGCAAAGAFLLFGLAWSLIVSACIAFVLAGILTLKVGL